MRFTKFLIDKLGVLTFIAVTVIFGWETLKVFNLKFSPVSDYAADMLLGNIIRDEGVLLVGHYSRFGFHHPGPFWFYWNRVFEIFLDSLPITRFQIWTIGSVIINSALLFFSGRGISEYLFDKIKYEVILILMTAVLMLAGGDLLATWMPNRLIILYIAFFICLINICKFNLFYLPWATLFCAMLVHGYVTMPVLTLPPLVLSLVIGYFRKKQTIPNSELYKRLWQSGLIGFVFMMPLIADILFSPDSNVTKIISIQNGFLNSPKPTWEQVTDFYWQLVFDQPLARPIYLSSFIAVFITLILCRREEFLRLVGMFSLFVFVTGIVITYYKTTPAPLYPFVARFYVGLPSVLVAAIWCVLVDRIKDFSKYIRYLTNVAVTIALVSLLYVSKKHESPIWADPEETHPIQLFADSIQHDQISGRSIVLNHSQHDHWGIVAGLMVELDRRKIPSCSTWSQLAFLFTPQMICVSNSKPDFMVVKSSECEGQCIAESKGFGLKSFK